MKKLFLLLVLFNFKSFAAESNVQIQQQRESSESQVVAISNFDVDRYMGRWYEIARLPTYFEKHCLAPITVDYSRGDDEISISNSCATISGDANTSSGVAYLTEENLSGSGKLVASSMPSWLRWTHIGRGDYWIIYADFLYSVVASPDHKYLWIYSRQESPPLRDIQKLIAMAQKQGFDTLSLVYNYPSYYAE